MREIYLIRHGMPDFPGGARMCLGRTDLPLGLRGRLQAALLGAELGEAGRDAFVRLTEEKLKGDALTDVYLVAAASGEDNYRNEAYYMPQEGKGVGPYIMAYAEMLRRG